MAFVISNIADWFILFGLVIFSFYYYLTYNFDYWKKRSIPYIKPVPLFGNSILFLKRAKHSSVDQMELYNTYRGEKYYGKFNFRTPTLVIRDPELVEAVLIKDFSHFYNRGFYVDPKLDRLSAHLINLRDQKWKSLRNKLTPVFSSVKLKCMHPTLIECCESLRQILDSYAESKEPFNARRVMADFTTEVIGHCAFGLKMNSLKNPDSEFRKVSKLLFRPSPVSRIRFIIRLIFPKLLSWLRWKQLPQKMEDYFIGVIKETVAAREASNVEVQDFLQLLINLRKEDQKLSAENKNNHRTRDANEFIMDETLMTSNAMVFFLAGYDTSASTLSFCLLELAKNPTIQQSLRNEIQRTVEEYEGIPSFEAVKKMHFLDQVISETLRMYPPVSAVPRECTKDWKIPNTDITITKGTMVQIPIYSLHHDLDYYPEPDRFIPERFADANKSSCRKGTFLPYGDGPRICIGKRFAELEMKVALSLMLMNYEFTLNGQTLLPLQFNPRAIFLSPLGGLWLNVKKISEGCN